MDGRLGTSVPSANRRRPNYSALTTKFSGSFCVVTCRMSAGWLKGNNAGIHLALPRTSFKSKRDACGKLKLSGRPARKILGSDWLRAERGSNRPFQKSPACRRTRCSGVPCLQHHLSLPKVHHQERVTTLSHSGLNFRATKTQRRQEIGLDARTYSKKTTTHKVKNTF